MSIGETVFGKVCTCRDLHAFSCLKHPNAKKAKMKDFIVHWAQKDRLHGHRTDCCDRLIDELVTEAGDEGVAFTSHILLVTCSALEEPK